MAPLPPAQRRSTRIVIVDDHAMFAESLRLALEQQADLSVVGSARTVREALSLVAASKPDVVVVDYRLPDGDGVALARAIRATGAARQIVMLTSAENDGVLLAAVDAGCTGFVTKTAPLDELVAAIRAAAVGEAVISPALLSRLLPRMQPGFRGVGADMTARELEVLRLLADGLSNAAIAARLTISVHTVRNHVASILAKLGVHSKLEALATAVREGILETARSRT
ncbi:MAG TPA: response regulator transcription factor [Mycobacteriales bacterium]|nr:response regulator transcription factor [Mycobacteriales bacterium]